MPDDEVPTLDAWAGGYDALLRMTRLFYGRYVPADELIGPLFAEMAPDHPERVASWLSEVFGGEKRYSQRYGGYGRMLSQHLGKHLTEAQRARWVSLLFRSADDVGLPTDPEFRAAFVAYIEWGSRIAVENSQPGARPPRRMPVPRWWWVCDATPGSRVSASRPEDAEAAEPQPTALPGPDVVPTFTAHIRPLFRRMDRESMRGAFDLWSVSDVREHAEAIHARLAAGTMPCDGPWPADQVGVLRRWIDAGMPDD